MSCLLSLTPCHPDGVLGMHTTPDASGASEPPGRLPPTPGSHGELQLCLAFSRQSRFLAVAFNLTVLNFAQASLLSAYQGETPKAAFEREQSRFVLWSARHPCLLRQVRASRSPSLLHRESRGFTSGIRNGLAVSPISRGCLK